jgi:hypothetical protein
MAKQIVWVEINPETEMPVRILKHFSDTFSLDPDVVRQMAKSVAVGFIREQVFSRAKRGMITMCEFCGNTITPGTGHMHEKQFKSKDGEVSLDNCVAICSECHIGPTGEHGNRRFQSSKIRET